MRVNKTLAVLLIAAVCPVVAAADESASAAASATIGDLQQVQSETVMLDAKVKRAEAKGKLRKAMVETGDDLQAASSEDSPVETSVIVTDLPTVIGISGAAGRLFATLRYPNGTTVSAKSGDQISGGYHVSQVGIDTVTLTRGDRRLPLQFGFATPPIQAAGAGNTGAAGRLPGVPTNSMIPLR
ncbi:type IV pilus biogenesis protein PilP [Pseudomonas viridiflava]|uniref:type IV pilus biogenesis protein PilP n=1 Tax=Pseudomonas viridiflava TaxID=33069 RepID=UPI000F021410|nr:type IV pilus biogenesis protein PilP [Pseudomonas viridiflava]